MPILLTTGSAEGPGGAARLLHSRYLLVASRLALRHVVHLCTRWRLYTYEEVVGLSARLPLAYGRGSCCARGPQGTKCGGVCVHTGTVGSSVLFTGVSSPGRSGSGVAAGIFYFSRADDPRGTR